MAFSRSFLLLAAFLLVLAPSVYAQVDWYQEFLNSHMQSEETFMAYGNGSFYVGVSGRSETGVIAEGRGSYHLGNGSYVIAPDGTPTDCSKQPELCEELLEEAANAPDPPNPPATTQPPADNPPSNDPPEQTQPDTQVAYFPGFEILRDGSLRYEPERRVGAWGVIMLKEWYEARRR
ncbi:MAG: hypothetical protein HKN04_13785 [Rhodothermaceae bacterium]|nr:hypothetical protein [Rhodothermaceae bacterium]